MKPSLFLILIVFCLVLFIEFYFVQAVKTVSVDYSPNKRKYLLWLVYFLAISSIIVFSIASVYPPPEWTVTMRIFLAIFFVLLLSKLLGCTFLLIDDIIRLFKWIGSKFSSNTITNDNETNNQISRLKFFSYLALTFTIIPAVSLLYGMLFGAYRYRLHKVKVKSPNLPNAFNGFKIIQLSDIHSGSFLSTQPLQKAFQIVMEQGADLILFTGDLVNNEANETEPHLESYKMLKAPHGVYSILGNHDYGDYKKWSSEIEKIENLNRLKQVQEEAGWKLLINQHVAIEKDGEKIALLGIENWGGNLHFPRYGKLDEAHKGTEEYPFKILLSHDPSHWDMQVTTETKFRDIDLTLSGHTHGMQLGIEIPGLVKWSPSKFVYKHWAGLYKLENQFLYVNRGLGFLGYPGRLGIWPEITVIELEKA
ncbi:MAG: metallophosphoesterase [Bacteroidia bacterium]|nr:metallophosphoesterase [Bacteroidia bacterium]